MEGEERQRGNKGEGGVGKLYFIPPSSVIVSPFPS